jgi:VWFA-related protein
LKRILITLVIAATTLPLAAQGRLQQPQEPAPAPLAMNIDVRIINVDVVVTDRRGNPITGLTRDDFEIRENNVPKTITNFYEVAGSRAKNVVADTVVNAPVPPTEPVAPQSSEDIPENMKRRIIFYIDNLSLAPFNRNRVFTQMKDFLKTAMRPGDEAMIATYNRSLKVRVPFTRDARQIETMLDTIAGESGQGIANRSERRDVEDRIREAPSYSEAVATARAYASSVEHDLRQSVASI